MAVLIPRQHLESFLFITYLLIILLQVPTVLSKTTRWLQSERVEDLSVWAPSMSSIAKFF